MQKNGKCSGKMLTVIPLPEITTASIMAYVLDFSPRVYFSSQKTLVTSGLQLSLQMFSMLIDNMLFGDYIKFHSMNILN